MEGRERETTGESFWCVRADSFRRDERRNEKREKNARDKKQEEGRTRREREILLWSAT